MNKKLLKMTLVALGMVAGSVNSWADDTFEDVYSRSITFGAANIWTTSDLEDWGGNSSLTIDVPTSADDTKDHGGLFFNPTKPGTSYSATKTFTISDNAKVKYDIQWYVGNSTGRTNNYEYLQLGDNVRISYNSSYNFYLNTDGKSTANNQIEYKKGISTIPVSIIFNTANKKVESFTFDGKDLSSQISEMLDGAFNTVSFGFVRGGSTANWAFPNGIKNITVSECKQEVSTVDYVITYKDGENIVNETTGTGAIGTEVLAKTVVYDTDGNRFLAISDEASSMVLSESVHELTVPVRKPYTATLNIETVINGESTSVSTPLVETDDKSTVWTYTYSLYAQKDGKYYVADNTETFGETGEFKDGDVINKKILYSKVDNDVVFFAEAENKAGTNVKYSNGADGVVAAQNKRNRGISVGKLDAGAYRFIGAITGNNKRSLVVREKISDDSSSEDIINSKILATLNASNQEETFSLADETDLVINGANSGTDKTNQSENFDYVIIKRVVVPATETATVSAAKYATFVPTYNVVAPAEVKTYAVKANEAKTGIELSEIVAGTVIPAGTAILVNAEEGSYDFTVSAEAASTIENNALVAATSDVTATGKEYALTQQNGVVGFARVQEGVVIPAGKAYLVVETAEESAAKFMAITVGGETTGINGVNATAADNDAYYTLQGQKTLKPAKGLYIHNGKKVIIK